MKINVVSREVAEAEFDRFVDLNEIDNDQSTFNAEEKADWARMKNTLLRKIEEGSLVLDEQGIFTYTPTRSKDVTPIVFHPPLGSALIAMDKKKKGEDVGKMYATMGEICGVDQKRFALMDRVDTKICLNIVTLFLA